MYSRLKQSKRALSFVLALVLVFNIVLSSGFFRVAVQAADEDAPSAVFYVDGVGSGNEDGSSADNAFKTIAKAYEKIPADNTKTVIVICGEVHIDDSLVIAHKDQYNTLKVIGRSEGTMAENPENDPYIDYTISYKKYDGTVVFTSKYDNVDYRKPSVGLYLDDIEWDLLGNTTFENIDIRNDAKRITANYYTLTFGEGIGVHSTGSNRIALYVLLGYTGNYLYNGPKTLNKKSVLNVRPHNVEFTMKSGTISYLYGTGSGDQGWNNRDTNATYVPYNVTLNIEAGEVSNLTVVGNKDASVNDVEISIGSSATVGDPIFTSNTGTIKGTKTIAYAGKTGTVFVAGFDALELTNSNVTVASLDTVKTIKTTDNSNLTVQAVPTEAIPVTVTMAGHKWTPSGALITAPKGTAKNMFTLTNTDGCAWEYADGDKATWTIVGDPDAFYVDGVKGSDENTGFSAGEPLKTLAAAYEKIDANNKVTYIVICGEVDLAESLVNASAKVTRQAIGNANGGIKHPGIVVLTSKYKGADYRDAGAGLSLDNKKWDLMGNTVLENINITASADSIVANYYSFYMGEGIGGELVASSVVLGFDSNAMYNNGPLKYRPKDITFTMKSGTIETLYGTGLSNQGWDNKDTTAAYVPINSTLNIEGGTISDRVYCAAAAVASINNINLNISGNAVVNNLQSKFTNANPIIHGEITCLIDLEGKNVTTTIIDNAFDKVYVIDTANKTASGEGAGTLTLDGGYDMVQKIAQDPASKMRYAAIKSNGVYTANPFNLTFAQVGLNTKAGASDNDVAICLRAMYVASDKAKPTDFGISHLESGDIENGVWKDYSAVGSAYSFEGKNLVNAFYNLSNNAFENLENTNYYRVYMKFGDEIVYSEYIAKITPATVLAGINEQIGKGAVISDTQRTSLENLVKSNDDIAAILTNISAN